MADDNKKEPAGKTGGASASSSPETDAKKPDANPKDDMSPLEKAAKKGTKPAVKPNVPSSGKTTSKPGETASKGQAAEKMGGKAGEKTPVAAPQSSSAQSSSAQSSSGKSTSDGGEAAPKKSGGGKFAWTLVFLLLFFIGGVAATPYLLPQVMPLLPAQAKAYFAPLMTAQSDGTPGQKSVADLAARLAQAEASIKDVRQIAGNAQQSAQDAVNQLDALAKRAPTNTGEGASDVDGGSGAAPDQLTEQVSGLQTRLDALAGQLSQLSDAQADQSDRYSRLQQSLSEIPEGSDGGVSPAALASLRSDLSSLTSNTEDRAETLQALQTEVAALSTTVSEQANALEAAQQTSQTLAEDRANAANAASAEALSQVADALRERISALEDRINVVSDTASSAADTEALADVNETVSQSIQSFETRLGALENVRQQATAAMVAGLETARLAQAVGNGRAYAAELNALRQLKEQAGPALPEIEGLLQDIAPFAKTGIPSGATLSSQLEDRAREILTAVDTPDGANWWERLLARLRNLVTVRKVGAEATGTAPADVLARAEAAARNGNWTTVVNEIGTLPPAAREAFGPWWAQAQARAKAQKTLADLSARLGVSAVDAAPTADGVSASTPEDAS